MTNTQKIDLKKLIPSRLKNELNTSLAANLFNRFLSEEQSVFVSGQVGKITDSTDAVIQAADLDRELNALIPALYFKTGTEESIFTFTDLVSKMDALGVDVNNLTAILAEQSLNFSPPIDLDKFINFANYYWVAETVTPTPALSWNEDLIPEYYVIKQPAVSSTVKLPVARATTRDIKMYGKDRAPEMVTITFTSATEFTLEGDQGTLYVQNSTLTAPSNIPTGDPILNTGTLTGTVTSFSVYAPDQTDDHSDDHGMNDATTSKADLLFSFTVTEGDVDFEVDDTFEINITYVTGSNTIAFTPGPSLITLDKGYVSNIVPDTSLMFIDGERVSIGDLVLVKNQTDAEENGVYTVKAGAWVRSPRYTTAEAFAINSRFYITDGAQAGKTFEITSATPDDLGVDNITFAAVVGDPPRQTNDWQIYNYWVHKDDVVSLDAAVVQATRPIIEYSNELLLNSHVDEDGFPSSSGTEIVQAKTRFNQLPQFDLFYYDGTHANKTSSIFYYEEDPDYGVDPQLLRRVKTTINSDYVFGVGIKDDLDRLLFFKKSNVLKTIWAPGVTAPTASTIQFSGLSEETKGNLVLGATVDTADNQTWTVTATSTTQFAVVGSRSGAAGTATVGTAFELDTQLEFTISAGSTPFAVGDSFTFAIHNKCAPRYVKKLTDGSIVNLEGGPAEDTDSEGTWLAPRRMFENMKRSLSTEIAFGDLIDHFRSIVKAQNNFEGSSFGINNYRELTPNLGYGGNIREHNSNFPLLASMLIQRGISPLSILDFAEKQYTTALASVDQYFISELVNYITSTQVISLSAIDATDAQVLDFMADLEADRAENTLLRDLYSDTTANVTNWPLTLPMMGLVVAAVPRVDFDLQLGIDVLVHHDGHLSPVSTNDAEFDLGLAQLMVERSDGTTTAGSLSASTPSLPYARQLWFKPSNQQLYAFDVIADTTAAPAGVVDGFWYRRSTNQLFEWNNTSGEWELSSDSLLSRWVPIDIASIRNSLVLAIETKLYEGVHPSLVQKADLSSYRTDAYAQIELAKFASKYGYDTYAPIFDASDAFTWNYKTAFGFSRWFDVYSDYFDQSGMLPTCRPNLEPWRLIGYATKAAANTGLSIDWDDEYASTDPDRLWTTDMWNDIIAARPGIKVCVNILTDELLPPYVSSSLPQSAYALLTATPADIDDVYVYGDNGPVENVWTKSLEYNYGLAKAYFKRDPLYFIDTLWGDTYVSSANNEIKLERNLLQPLAPSKFLLHGERLTNVVTRTAVDHFTAGTATATAAGTARFVVTHVEDNATFFYAYINDELQGIVEEGVAFDMTSDGITFNDVVIDDLGIPFSLGDSFTAALTTSTVTYTFTAALVKKFVGLGQLFTNLLRFNYTDVDMSEAANAYRGWDIRLVHRLGALIRGDSLKIKSSIGILPDTAFNLRIKRSENLDSKWISALRVQLVQAGTLAINAAGNYAPAGAGTDWVFRIETYNPQHPIFEYYTFNTSGVYTTFNALTQKSTTLAWKRYSEHDELTLATTPFTVTGVQNLLNFIYGYIDRLEEQGFTINTSEEVITDEETGRNLNWQLEVEKLVDRIYRDLGPGEGHVLNPFMHALWVDTPVGLMSRYTEGNFIDTNAAQAAYDVLGSVIPVNQLFVIRTDEATVTYTETPIFSAHVFNDEFEHVILFNSSLSDETGSATIFDQFLGMRISGARLSFTRQAEVNYKPTFNGFVLSGHDVKRNITSSVDAIGNYYDASKTFSEETTAKHALALLGFNSKPYFSDIGISDATQFNFWRGLIQAKGTNASIDAFVNYKSFTDASVDEYWAYKVAEYGDARSRTQPEIKIEQADCQQQFTQLQFYSSADSTYDALPLYIQIENDDDARWFSIDDLSTGLTFDALPVTVTVVAASTGYYKLSDIFHNGDSGAPLVFKAGVSTTDAEMINANLLKVDVAGTYTITGFTWQNPVKQAPIKLFDYQSNVLIKQIALWHPAIGIHAYEPLEAVDAIAQVDPALYNYTTQTTDNPSYSRLKPWGKKEVGRVWWDTANLGYVPYYDATIFPNRSERHARWGSLAEWATIDIFEWTESTVPPDEYDALALEQEGQTDIPQELRASGKAAKKTFYSRDRSITMRPVAWSQAGVGDADSHPAFGPAYSTRVIATGTSLFADSGRTEAINLVEDRHFGGWLNNKPVGEAVIGADIVFNIGSSTDISAPEVTDLTVTEIDKGRLGNRIGQITLSTRSDSSPTVFLRMSDEFDFFQELEITDWLGTTDDVRELNFTDFGIKISASGSTTAATFAAALVAGWEDVYVREGVSFEQIIALPDTVFINDADDPESVDYDYGWKTWAVPSQDDLDADLLSPRNTWLPYLGDQVTVDATSAVVADMGTPALELKSGISINRYASTWSSWVPLQAVRSEATSDGSTAVSFDRDIFLATGETIDANRLSVYANGIQLNPQSYAVLGEVGEEAVEIVNTLPEGTNVLLIYRSYQPTDEELEFDPEVEDDPSIQTQYKADYQYTKVDVRNDVGVITSAKYYFWVQDKSVVQPNKNMSLVQAKSILLNGPSQFAMFSRYNSDVDAFDSCVIAGLNSLVTNNSTYKLRFVRNFTLRDDPEQMNLKNTHAEWALIRRSQTSKIPESLWVHLTNAVAASDAGGNSLPSQARIDYDLRNGTKTQFGFRPGQIFADTALLKTSITNTILNTALRIRLGSTSIPDYITALNMDESDEWFVDGATARQTMDLIWATARPRQINEIFFEVLEDALSNNYEFSDLFKTSLISVSSTTRVEEQIEGEISDGIF